ncbi:hypothetical protein HY251_04880 [bacterium]|nr:hypothetical protein [bacterium]
MSVICPILFMGGLVAFIFLLISLQAHNVGNRSYKTLAALVEDLEPRLGLEGTFPDRRFAGVADVAFDGSLPSGRGAHVRFLLEGKLEITRLRVAADDAPRLTITEETILTPLAKWLGIVREIEVGDKRFDDRFLLESRSERIEKVLRPEVRSLITRAFDEFKLRKLELDNGSLAADLTRMSLDPHEYGDLLALLDEIALAFDRTKIRIHALGTDRFALSGIGGKTRCAYCHEHVTGEEPELVACDRCHTVFHEECWAELGHCGVIGCTGGKPERGRVH